MEKLCKTPRSAKKALDSARIAAQNHWHMECATNPNAGPRVERIEVLDRPISVVRDKPEPPAVREAKQFFNTAILHERESHGKRTILRLTWEVYGRKRAKNMTFHRLRGVHVLFDCPNGDQAKQVIDAIRRIANNLDGKYLATPPAE